jgi:hypothetical protein
MRQPDSARAQTGLARLLHRRRDTAGASAAVERALALDPRDPAAHVVRSVLRFEAGAYEASLESLDEAESLGVQPRWQILRNRAITLAAMGLHAEGVLADCARRYPYIKCGEGLELRKRSRERDQPPRGSTTRCEDRVRGVVATPPIGRRAIGDRVARVLARTRETEASAEDSEHEHEQHPTGQVLLHPSTPFRPKV